MTVSAIFTRAAVSSLLLASTMIASTGVAETLPPGHDRAHAAEQALGANDPARAVHEAEAAVAASPEAARYRTLLGRAYLRAGRFRSGETAFGEALTLDRADARAAGGLVLAQIALDRPGAARASLTDYAAIIPAADLGLLVALAGDPAGGAMILETLARSPAATARGRQNLALAYALGGHWPQARAMAAVDLGEAGAEARMTAWSQMGGGGAARTHVASLVGSVPAAVDPGRPVALALGRDPAAAPVAIAAAEPEARPMQFAAQAGIRFAPRREIVQPLPASYAAAVAVRSDPRPAPVRPTPVAAVSAPRRVASAAIARGGFVVQLGAYDSPALARGAWTDATRRHPLLADHRPAGGTVSNAARTFYRLSAGGFTARAPAVGLCEGLRRSGASCFVRAVANDRPLEIAFGPAPTRLAAR